MTLERPTVSVVVLAYLDEPWVEDCVAAVLASEGVVVDVVVVDNGCTTGATDRLDGRSGVQVLRPSRNLGFAGGCNLGASAGTGDYLALVNSDALVEPGALRALVEVAGRVGVGLASGSIRLADRPELLNSAGNPVHFSMLTWSGALGEPARDHAVERDVASASGAGLVLRRALWEELGGFAEEYFAYLEDTELSLRCWLRGLRVVYCPVAVVLHRYEFSRNALKLELLERNRAVLLMTVYERRTLLALLPGLLLVELALLALSVLQGWWRSKLRAYAWLLRHRSFVRRRRALLQAERLVGDEVLLDRVAARLDARQPPPPPGTQLLNAVLAAAFRLGRRRVLRSPLRR